MSANKYKMDMTTGSLPVKIFKYMIPLGLTYLLQMMFHAADLAVIGRFASNDSLAAIGTTGTTLGVIVNLFVGISIGANALVARCYGAKDSKNIMRATHTSIAIALIGGFISLFIGLVASRSMMVAIDVPEKLMPAALCYLRICFLGTPFMLLYNFGSAILRAFGDTRRPLRFLIYSGIINVLLNIVLVVALKLDVAGVAIATVISQAVSAFLVLRVLVQSHGACRVHLRNIRIDLTSLKHILLIGIPAGIQSSCFALSNLIIQGAINSFGAVAMAAITATNTLEWGLYSWCYALHQTAISFIGQNLGANNNRRIISCFTVCSVYGALISLVLGWAMFMNIEPLLKLFSKDVTPEFLHWAYLRVQVLFTTYALLGFMDTATGALRGLGVSIFPMITTILMACVFRIWWVNTIFSKMPTMRVLMASYPVSWLLVTVICWAAFAFIMRKKLQRERFKSTRAPVR